MAYNYQRKYNKEKRIEKIAEWIDLFYLENGTIPSYNRISNHFQISRTTTYALMAEINRFKNYKGIPYENNHLPLQPVPLDKETHTEKETETNLSSSGGEAQDKNKNQEMGIRRFNGQGVS